MIRFLVLATLILAAMPVSAARPLATIPASEEQVLERLPRGYASLPSSGARLPMLSRVTEMLRVAARSGDMRLAARAEAYLRRYPTADPSPALLHARAFSAQHRHDFPEALRLLNLLIVKDPRDADARLARAQISLVQGRLEIARADCARLALGLDAGNGLLCVAALSLRQGNDKSAAEMLDRALAQPSRDDDARRYALVMRAEAAAAGHARADGWYRQALALAPDDVRTLASYASYLRGVRRSHDALSLLAAAPRSDGLELQRTLAAHESRAPEAAVLAAAQARRYALARASGFEPELRDEAEFLLVARDDSRRALALATRNFATQRDREDVRILLRAANAAHRPDALIALYAWARSQRVELGDAGTSHR